MRRPDVRASDKIQENLLILISINNNPTSERFFRLWLWGYPDLVKKLFEVVGPNLVEERERGRREREEAEEQRRTMEHVNKASEVKAEYNDSATPSPSQSRRPTSVDNVTGIPDIGLRQTDVQPSQHIFRCIHMQDERACSEPMHELCELMHELYNQSQGPHFYPCMHMQDERAGSEPFHELQELMHSQSQLQVTDHPRASNGCLLLNTEAHKSTSESQISQLEEVPSSSMLDANNKDSLGDWSIFLI